MEQTPVRIGGDQVTTAEGIAVTNPYNGSQIAIVPACAPEHVDRACRGAAAALAGGEFPQYARALVLERASDLLADRVEDFARTIALEAGKPIRTARLEARRCVDTLAFSAVEARRLTGEMIPMDGSESGAGRLGFALRVPIGVVGAITPFNFPLNLVAHKLGPALAAGCPVVLKPASATPLSAINLVEVLIEAGMPPDWISVVTGPGHTVGDALVEHPIPAMLTFTGSADVGWQLVARSPRKKHSLELGSNSPLIVEADADLALVAEKVKAAGFAHAGQSCISTQRILVQRSVQKDLVEELGKAVATLVVGDPLQEDTDVGPLITPQDTERVSRWIQDALGAGAELVTGGEIRDGVLTPTVVNNVDPTLDLCAKEVFGPVVAVLGYDDFAEAIDLANDTQYGLHAGVFTNDLNKALAAARKLQYGGVLINDVPTYRADQQPYGGTKASGNTREGPAYAVREMTELRFVGFSS